VSSSTGPTLWANRDFRLLFGAQLTSLVGSGVTSVALAAFAYRIAGGSATVVVGIALMLRILAFVLVSPLAGVLADRVDRKRLLIAADVVRVGLLGVFPFVTTVWQVYLLTFAINAATAFFTPAFEAVLPEVVGPLYARRLLVAHCARHGSDAGSAAGRRLHRRGRRAADVLGGWPDIRGFGRARDGRARAAHRCRLDVAAGHPRGHDARDARPVP
jgi:MFS family permease